jgi:lysophospholipase L1-like esterase
MEAKMRTMALASTIGFGLAIVAGCSSSPSSTNQPGAGPDMTTVGVGGNGGGAGSGGGGGTGGSGGGGGGGMLPSAFGTYIEIGDSISDKGGSPTTAPYYYDLLFSNDNTTYPRWAGLDLKTKFGVQNHVHAAVAGSQTKDLLGQVMGLAASLPGPILVTVTSGGNDLRAAGTQAIAGTDSMYITQMATNIDSFLAAITTKDRFGSGVEVYVLFANVYDPTDKTGDFMSKETGGSTCPLPLSLYPKADAVAVFGRWDKPFMTELPKYPNVFEAPLYDTFLGHGIHDMDDWFYTDCIHPNKQGMHELRRMFWKALTGQDGPA